jgi:hypothetical protein
MNQRQLNVSLREPAALLEHLFIEEAEPGY